MISWTILTPYAAVWSAKVVEISEIFIIPSNEEKDANYTAE